MTALGQQYDLRRLTMLPLQRGNDSLTWIYRLETEEGRSLLLKVRKSDGFTAACLLIPRFLRQSGLRHTITPHPTVSGKLWLHLGNYRLALFPYVEGEVGANIGLTAKQWQAFGSFVRSIHELKLPTDLQRLVPRETYIPSRRHLIRALDAAVTTPPFGNDTERALAAFWKAQGDTIRTLVRQADLLGRRLKQASPPAVLCHGDMHPWNLLVDGQGDWWLVDWDEVKLAPKERDLMFANGGIGGDRIDSQVSDSFFSGYGRVTVNTEALIYYRCAWAVQDIAAYGERVFFLTGLTKQERWSAVEGFKKLFAPEHIVARALQSAADSLGVNLD